MRDLYRVLLKECWLKLKRRQLRATFWTPLGWFQLSLPETMTFEDYINVESDLATALRIYHVARQKSCASQFSSEPFYGFSTVLVVVLIVVVVVVNVVVVVFVVAAAVPAAIIFITSAQYRSGLFNFLLEKR